MLADFEKIPISPGIYYFLNKANTIIYIGKAKNLKSRVSSYWQKTTELTIAKKQMVNEVAHIRYTLVDNETESLLLEASQIKKHLPKYNIVLKDDKKWGYIVITTEKFPRIIVVHGRQRRKGQYFGPYTSTLSARTTVRLLHRLFSLHTKNSDLVKKDGQIFLKEKFGGLDTGLNLIDQQQYQNTISSAKKIISGQTKDLANNLKKQLELASSKQNYELAKLKKEQLLALNNLKLKQKIISEPRINQDVIALAQSIKTIAVTVMQIRAGILGDKFNFLISNPLQLNAAEILNNFINQFYTNRVDVPKKIITSFKLKKEDLLLPKNVKIEQALNGKNLALLKLVQKNAQDYLAKNTKPALEQKLLALQKLLSLPKIPQRIEIYDISNIQGEFAVGSMVVCINGQMASDQYRIFKIKTISGPDDMHSLAEVLSRRLKHSEWPEPDLIILDGGKPQLNVVYPILTKDWQNKTIALAKKEEEIFLPKTKEPIRLARNHELSLFIQHLRNQAHKFAINNYRRQHRKNYQ